jgi:predicted transcriptional regulator
MTVELTTEHESQLKEIAENRQQTVHQVAQEAVADFLAYRTEMEAFVGEGEESAEREGWLTHDEVFDRVVSSYTRAA